MKQRAHGRVHSVLSIDVLGCTNALKGRMPEKSHPEHPRSFSSMKPRHTIHPEHRRSFSSMKPRHTIHPEHKKPLISINGFKMNSIIKSFQRDYLYFCITKVAFVPPKPKLFDITKFNSASRASVTMSKPSAFSSSVEIFIDGATKLFSIINIE
jgi:hypothetical protein